VLEPLIGAIVGCPLVPIPLPARWKIIFHEPVHLATDDKRTQSKRSYCADVAQHVQATVQKTLDRQAARYPLARLSKMVAALVWQREIAKIAGRPKAPEAEPAPVPARDGSRQQRGRGTAGRKSTLRSRRSSVSFATS
jgi:hypothetical protein